VLKGGEMKFPDMTRVIYGANPLSSVICFVAFPRILAIDNELPVDFQKSLVTKYPFLETNDVRGSVDSRESESARSLVYEFFSPNKEVMVALAGEFLCIRTTKYERWETFREHVQNALRTLLATYTLSVFTHVSLNYVNVIDKEALNLGRVGWGDLIRTSLLGPLADADIGGSLEELSSQTSIEIEEGSVRIVSGLVTKPGSDDPCFLIDNDFIRNESLDADEHKSLDLLDQFNRESGRVFRWCIKNRLHEALRPTAVL